MFKKRYVQSIIISLTLISMHNTSVIQKKEQESVKYNSLVKKVWKQIVTAKIRASQKALNQVHYMQVNAPVLIDNYKAELEKTTLKIDDKTYTLLQLLEKFKHGTRYQVTHQMTTQGDASTMLNISRQESVFYLQEIRLTHVSINKLRIQIAQMINDQVHNPSIVRRKAENAFKYLQKKIQAIDLDTVDKKDILFQVLLYFKENFGHLNFDQTQSGSCVFAYAHFIDLKELIRTSSQALRKKEKMPKTTHSVG